MGLNSMGALVKERNIVLRGADKVSLTIRFYMFFAAAYRSCFIQYR